MADHRHHASVANTNLRPRVVIPMSDGSTSAPHESVVALPVVYEGPVATLGRTTAAGPVADDIVTVQMTALFGVHRDDGVWVTECAWCERVRSIAGEWRTVTASARATIRAERTHGICAECADRCLAQAAVR